MLLRSVSEVEVRRISPDDTNYFAVLFDPADDVDVVCVIEIFTVGGKTPENAHSRAHEFFYAIAGTGRAYCEGEVRSFGRGDALMLRPGTPHVIENTGPAKLYTLTFMVPNEEFAELIRAGEPVELDAEDRETLAGLVAGGASA